MPWATVMAPPAARVRVTGHPRPGRRCVGWRPTCRAYGLGATGVVPSVVAPSSTTYPLGSAGWDSRGRPRRVGAWSAVHGGVAPFTPPSWSRAVGSGTGPRRGLTREARCHSWVGPSPTRDAARAGRGGPGGGSPATGHAARITESRRRGPRRRLSCRAQVIAPCIGICLRADAENVTRGSSVVPGGHDRLPGRGLGGVSPCAT